MLAEAVGAEDPFGLEPGEIVDRALADGYTPVVNQPLGEPFRTFGRVTEVEREEQVE